MRAVRAEPGPYIDTAGRDDQPGHVVTPAWLARVPQVRGVARYLRLDGTAEEEPSPGGDHVGCWSLSRRELGWILEAGRTLIPLQFGPSGGDRLSGTLGLQRGSHAARAASLLELPQGVHLWCDLEGGAAERAGKGACDDYVRAWSMAVTSCGYRAGLYVGDARVPLLGPDLYALPLITSYWGAAFVSRRWAAPWEPLPRGWAIRQHAPALLEGLRCDADDLAPDGRAETPWVVAADLLRQAPGRPAGRLLYAHGVTRHGRIGLDRDSVALHGSTRNVSAQTHGLRSHASAPLMESHRTR